MRYVTVVVVALAVLVGLTSCFDPEPAEISIIATKDGQPQGCTVQVFNERNKQIQEVSTDWNGIGYIKDLKPGTYTLKFIDNQRNPYPAMKKVKVVAGDAQPVNVELTEGPAEPVD